VVVRGAKMHQTGCVNSHWLMVMPTMRLTDADADYAIAAAIPVDHANVSFISSIRGTECAPGYTL
jgi:4-hydroxybutyryl-CoA dehydratase/vinylacetyl-CoA-Delta-isomerase